MLMAQNQWKMYKNKTIFNNSRSKTIKQFGMHPKTACLPELAILEKMRQSYFCSRKVSLKWQRIFLSTSCIQYLAVKNIISDSENLVSFSLCEFKFVIW